MFLVVVSAAILPPYGSRLRVSRTVLCFPPCWISIYANIQPYSKGDWLQLRSRVILWGWERGRGVARDGFWAFLRKPLTTMAPMGINPLAGGIVSIFIHCVSY